MATTPTAQQTAVISLYQALFSSAIGSIKLNTYMAGFTGDMTALTTAMMADSAWAAAGYGSTPAAIYSRFIANVCGSNLDVTNQSNIVNIMVGLTDTTGANGYTVAQLLGTVTNLFATADWTGNVLATTVAAFRTQVGVDASYTLDQGGLNPLPNSGQAQTYILTAGADILTGTAGNDTFVATNSTLTPGDNLNGVGGNDTLRYSTASQGVAAAYNHGAFFMDKIQNLVTTADSGDSVTFDLSGTTGLLRVAANNSSATTTTFNQITTTPTTVLDVANNAGPFHVEANTLTNGANVVVQFQDAKVVGTNTVYLDLMNNYNPAAGTGIGNITIGSVSAAAGGIENLVVTTSSAASLVNTLNVGMTNLTILGDQNLVIVNALNGTERLIDASGFTANLGTAGAAATATTPLVPAIFVESTGTGANAVEFRGSSANDYITFRGTTGNHTITANGGNDDIQLGTGDDNVNLGAGNDIVRIGLQGLTVNDTIVGGDGNDTLILTATDYINLTESMRVSTVETFDLRAAGSTLVVAQSLIDTATKTNNVGFTVTTANTAANTTTDAETLTPATTGGHTIDLTNVTNISTFQYVSDAAATAAAQAIADTVVATETQINSQGIFTFGSGMGDTLRMVDATHLTLDDFAQVTGLDIIRLTANNAFAQNYQVELSDAIIRQASAYNTVQGDAFGLIAAGTADAAITATSNLANGADRFQIVIDNTVPNGSTVVIDLTAFTAAQIARYTVNPILITNGANVVVQYKDATGLIAKPAWIDYVVAADPDRILNLQGTLSDTTSGFQITNNVIAGSGSDALNILTAAPIVFAAGSKIIGGGGTDTLTVAATATGTNIAAATMANDVENLVFSGAITMTGDQHNGNFATITASAAAGDTINLSAISTGAAFTTRATVENYSFVGGETVTVAAGTTAVNLTGSAVAAASTVSIAGQTVTGTWSLNDTGTADVINATTGANITGVNAGAATTAERLTLTGAITLTAAQYNPLQAGGITAAGAADSVTITTSSLALNTHAAVEGYTLNGTGADTITSAVTDAQRALETINLAGNLGATDLDTVVITNAAVNDAVNSAMNITGFTQANDKLQLFVGATATSNGVFVNDWAAGGALSLGTAGVLEISAAAYQAGVPTNTAALLAWMGDAAHTVTALNAGAAAAATVIAYTGLGQAAIYQATASGGIGTVYDALEYIGIVNAANNVLTGANFA